MLALAIPIAFALMSLALLLNLWRVVRGPDLPDRILALDTLYINSIALLVLFGPELAQNQLLKLGNLPLQVFGLDLLVAA